MKKILGLSAIFFALMISGCATKKVVQNVPVNACDTCMIKEEKKVPIPCAKEVKGNSNNKVINKLDDFMTMTSAIRVI